MKLIRKLMTAGLAIGLLTMVFATPSSAMSQKKAETLEYQGNTAVDVQTELSCSSHILTAKITNKTNKALTPDVTFNKMKPNFEPSPIEPGKTGSVFYSYSGNKMPMNIEVKVDTYDPLMLNPMIDCEAEQASFLITQASDSAVVGILTNNHSILPRTVFTRVAMGDVRTETLQPGESKVIALPYQGTPEQKFVPVTIATEDYESTYSVNLEQAQSPPLPLPPTPKLAE
jgi:hypothetical protein